MKLISASKALLVIAGFLASLAAASGQTIINLTQDATVRANGSYIYYQNSGAATPFTTVLTPRATFNGGEASTESSQNSFATGHLTDNLDNVRINGWGGSSSGTTFDIVFDLGGVYTITEVILTYTDASGARWSTTENAQKLYLSTTAPTASTLLSSPFNTGTFLINGTRSNLSFSGAATEARYVILDLSSGNASGGSSFGGMLVEVKINGYTVIPEPGVNVTLAVAGILILFSASRRPSAFGKNS